MDRITPRVDIAFKKIFGVEENKDLLISLINSIVSEEDQVADITLLNPYNPKNFKNDKLTILDIKAKGLDGKRFNIEIQLNYETDYNKRALYYWARLYTEQLKTSEDFSSLSKAIGIHILNFTHIPESPKYHNVYHIVEKDHGFRYFKDLELHTIELRKFTDTVSNELTDVIEKIKTSLDIWVAFLTKYNLFDKDNLPESLKNTGLKKALNVLEIMNFNEEEREGYEDHLKGLRLRASAIKKLEQDAIDKGMAKGIKKGRAEGMKKGRAEGIKKGRAEGIEKGRAEGIEKGRAEGIKKGRAEGIEKGRAQEKHQIALKLIQLGVGIDHIIDSTGLTRQEIEFIITGKKSL